MYKKENIKSYVKGEYALYIIGVCISPQPSMVLVLLKLRTLISGSTLSPIASLASCIPRYGDLMVP
jgi:hypothetical protein